MDISTKKQNKSLTIKQAEPYKLPLRETLYCMQYLTIHYQIDEMLLSEILR